MWVLNLLCLWSVLQMVWDLNSYFMMDNKGCFYYYISIVATSLSLSCIFAGVMDGDLLCFCCCCYFTMEKLECMFSFVWTRTSKKILSLISVNLVFEILFFFLKFLQMEVGFTMTAKNDLVKNPCKSWALLGIMNLFFFCAWVYLSL